MGDIIKKYPTRSSLREKPRFLKYYFDTGSPRTFVKESAALQMREVIKLSVPKQFYGLGDGGFKASYLIDLEVKLLGIWVPHPSYVVPDEVLGTRFDVLLGHDFMQIYDIHVKPKRREVLIDKEALKMALKVRSVP